MSHKKIIIAGLFVFGVFGIVLFVGAQSSGEKCEPVGKNLNGYVCCRVDKLNNEGLWQSLDDVGAGKFPLCFSKSSPSNSPTSKICKLKRCPVFTIQNGKVVKLDRSKTYSPPCDKIIPKCLPNKIKSDGNSFMGWFGDSGFSSLFGNQNQEQNTYPPCE